VRLLLMSERYRPSYILRSKRTITRSYGTMVELTATNIRHVLRSSRPHDVSALRALRRAWSVKIKAWPAKNVIDLGLKLIDDSPWGRLTAYELIAYHPSGIAALTPRSLSQLSRGLADWPGVDTFACYLAGPAWREERLPTKDVHAWLRSADRWERRIGVVCTVALNVRARGGTGDPKKTLDVCRRVVADRDDMVVKAVSWALRSLVEWDAEAVAKFLTMHHAVLAARIKREVANKLRTGLKNSPAKKSRLRT
jgi:3-methyladenine DNA glycosylase AlkD